MKKKKIITFFLFLLDLLLSISPSFFSTLNEFRKCRLFDYSSLHKLTDRLKQGDSKESFPGKRDAAFTKEKMCRRRCRRLASVDPVIAFVFLFLCKRLVVLLRAPLRAAGGHHRARRELGE